MATCARTPREPDASGPDAEDRDRHGRPVHHHVHHAIGAALLYGPVVDDPRWVLGDGPDTGIRLGALFELILIITNLGTAIVIYPLLRRHNEVLSLSYVAARVVECTFILVGLLALLVVVTLRQQGAGADPDSLVGLAQSFVAVNRWTFVLGPGFVVGIGNGIILGWLMYRSGLLPRRYWRCSGSSAGRSSRSRGRPSCWASSSAARPGRCSRRSPK